MSVVNVTNVTVLDNPAPFTNPFQFEITFECLADLPSDLEWKIIYVGSAESEAYDQVLDSILVGPVPVGVSKFVFQADAPNADKIPDGDILGITAVLITCSYRSQEFIRVGYYVNNEYSTPELLAELAPGARPDVRQLTRDIHVDKPRVTRFAINWDDGVEPPSDPNIPSELLNTQPIHDPYAEALAAQQAAAAAQASIDPSQATAGAGTGINLPPPAAGLMGGL